MEAYLSSVNLVHEAGSRLKVDDGFREVISKIKSTGLLSCSSIVKLLDDMHTSFLALVIAT
jgi:hypothetical protein